MSLKSQYIPNNASKVQHRSSSLKSTWDIGKVIFLLISESMLEGQGSLDIFSKKKRAKGCHFSFPFPQPRSRHLLRLEKTLPMKLVNTMCPTFLFFCSSTPCNTPTHRSPCKWLWPALILQAALLGNGTYLADIEN